MATRTKTGVVSETARLLDELAARRLTVQDVKVTEYSVDLVGVRSLGPEPEPGTVDGDGRPLRSRSPHDIMLAAGR